MRRFGQIALLILLSAALLLAGCGGGDGGGDDSGDVVPAPDFGYQDEDGETVYLHDFLGKVVVLNFWATWCAPCRLEMPHLQRAHEEFSADDVVILAINVGEGVETVNAFMAGNGYDMTVFLDGEGRLAAGYGVNVYPMTFFIDGEGNIDLAGGVKFGPFLTYEELETQIGEMLKTNN